MAVITDDRKVIWGRLEADSAGATPPKTGISCTKLRAGIADRTDKTGEFLITKD